MTDSCKLIIQNELEEGTATGGSASNDRVPGNVLSSDPDLTCSIGSGITVTMPAAKSLGGYAVLRVNASGNMTARISGTDYVQGGTTSVVDMFSSAVSSRTVRFTGAGLMSYFIAGPVFESAVNIRLGGGVDLVSDGELGISVDGRTWINYSKPGRIASFEWGNLTDNEAQTLHNQVIHSLTRKTLVAASIYSGIGTGRETQAAFVGRITQWDAPARVRRRYNRAFMRIEEVTL